MAVLRRDLDFRRLSLLTLTQNLVRAGSSIALAGIFGLDASALVLGGLAGMIAMVVLALAFVRVPVPRWRADAIRDLLPYGGPAALACFCWAGFRNGDYAIVGARLGPTQAGYYWRGFQLAVEYQTKISSMMTQMAFPVLARTAGADEMFALRRRMVQLLTVVSFPVLASLVILAPVVVPWVFGPTWEPAVLPTQILAGAGAASVVIDAVGSVLMAAGRARALLAYGVSHFAVYVVAVFFASRYGLAGVGIAAVTVHFVFLIVAYEVLLHGRAEATLRFLWDDVSAATVSCVALVAVALPVSLALGNTGAAPIVHLVLVGGAAGVAYLGALRAWYPGAWQDLSALLRRVAPIGGARAALVRRVPVLAGRS
jgi:lipopolysaccharide exporter